MVATTNVFSGSAIQDVPIHTSSEDMNDNKEDKKDDKESKNKLKKDCHKITIDVFELLSSAVDQRILTSKDRKNYMEALSDKNLEDGGALTLEKKKEFLENLQRYAPSFVSEAQTMTSKFISDIEEAKKKGWISENSAKRWLERLEMRSTDWPSTKEFLNNFNKKYMDNWKNLAKKREQAKNEIKKLKVTEKEIPELIKFNDVGFNDWHYSIKSEVIDTTLTQLALHDEKNQKNYQLYNKTKTILEREVKMGVMRKDQSAMWLESLFNRKRPNEEIESIIKGKLTEYVGEWAKLRYRFDRIIRRMSKGVIKIAVIK
ncbi:MAG: hypothetical protein KAS32_02840 [Candidatus Peribacteraceae bacterium]|nr:hypothetical protein [Candidatus Peribacteraceae bacterium]